MCTALGASLLFLLGAGLGAAVLSSSTNADCPQTSPSSQGRIFIIVGNTSEARHQRDPQPDGVPSVSVQPSPLPTGLRGHFAVALPDRLLVGGGTNVCNHDARYIGQ